MARMTKVSISFNNKHIANAYDLSVEMAKRRLENDKRSLSLFTKALVVSKDFMKEKLEEPFSCELDLGKLLHHAKADAFLAVPDLDFRGAFLLLREMGVVKRDYDYPIFEFTRHLSWTINEVNELTEKYFGTAIKGANDCGVLLEFGGSTINSIESLSKKIFEKSITQDGRTFCLFQKAVYDTAVIAFNDSGEKLKFTLNIAVLMPESLSKKGISHKEIDDIIDDHDYKKTKSFLLTVGALVIEREKKTSSD